MAGIQIESMGEMMGKFKLGFGLLVSLAWVPLAQAEDSTHVQACRTQASAIADRYAENFIERAADLATAPKGSFIAISYGHKYVMPSQPQNNGDVHQQTVGDAVAKRTNVYQDELSRCLGIYQLHLVPRNKLVIIE